MLQGAHDRAGKEGPRWGSRRHSEALPVSQVPSTRSAAVLCVSKVVARLDRPRRVGAVVRPSQRTQGDKEARASLDADPATLDEAHRRTREASSLQMTRRLREVSFASQAGVT
jgi:hypothetical protein